MFRRPREPPEVGKGLVKKNNTSLLFIVDGFLAEELRLRGAPAEGMASNAGS